MDEQLQFDDWYSPASCGFQHNLSFMYNSKPAGDDDEDVSGQNFERRHALVAELVGACAHRPVHLSQSRWLLVYVILGDYRRRIGQAHCVHYGIVVFVGCNFGLHQTSVGWEKVGDRKIERTDSIDQHHSDCIIQYRWSV